jgi:aldose 1-epimerase
MPVDEFGVLPDGRAVHRLVLGTAPGPVLHLLDLGATTHRLELTAPDGVRRDVLLGLPTVGARLASTDYLGGTIGRYANRIASGRFELDGAEVRVGAHEHGNHLHGGPDGFDRRLWDVVTLEASAATLQLVSRDGDQGFPGEVTARAAFEVDAGGVTITLTARTDAATVVNLTNHAYFNLDGAGEGTVDDHLLQVAGDAYTPVDPAGIPLDGHAPVDGTGFDFRGVHPLGSTVLDHNYVLRGAGLRAVAVLASPVTGLRLEMLTDQPGLQVYTGDGLGLRAPEASAGLRPRSGIALEPQLFPDSPNHPDFPSAALRPGEVYRSTIRWQVGASGADA